MYWQNKLVSAKKIVETKVPTADGDDDTIYRPSNDFFWLFDKI